MGKKIFELKYWHPVLQYDHTDDEEFCSISGLCFGNPKFKEGHKIHTSMVVNVETFIQNNDNTIGYFLLNTYNSVYKLNFNQFNSTYKYMLIKLWDLFNLTEQIYKEVLAASKKHQNDEFHKIDSFIENNEFYIVLRGEQPMWGYFKENDKLHRVDIDCHVGMIQDSYLFKPHWIRHDNYGVDLRYFPKWGQVELYHISDNIKKITMYNIGDEIWYYKPFARDGLKLEHNGKLVLFEKDFKNIEGLMSPDSYNGKSLLTNMFPDDEKDLEE